MSEKDELYVQIMALLIQKLAHSHGELPTTKAVGFPHSSRPTC